MKLASFILLNLLLCVVFFLLSAIPDHGIYMASWHFELFLIWYPLTALLFGILSVVSSFGDWIYLLLMGVIFLTVSCTSAVNMSVIALPAAFLYTLIMLGAMLVSLLLRAAILAYLQYRNYKRTKESKINEPYSES